MNRPPFQGSPVEEIVGTLLTMTERLGIATEAIQTQVMCGYQLELEATTAQANGKEGSAPIPHTTQER